MQSRYMEVDRARPYVLGFIGAVILMAFAIVNGYAVFFNDTRSYVRGPALAIEALTHRPIAPEWRSRAASPAPIGGTSSNLAPLPSSTSTSAFTANRSIYYGALALFGYVTSDFWLTIFLQALAISIPAAIIIVRGFDLGIWSWLVTAAILATFTTLGPIAALIMPDVLAPVIILCAAALVSLWEKLTRFDTIVLTVLAAFGALGHLSHVALLGAIVLLFGAYRVVRRTRWISAGGLTLLAGAALIGILGQVFFVKGLEWATGQKPLVLPHVTAHLQATPAGLSYLKTHCPQVGLAVSRYLDQLPVHWADFMGEKGAESIFVAADAATKRALSDEQLDYALGVLREDPVGMAGSYLKDGVAQLFRFSLSDLEVTPEARENFRTSFPRSVSAEIEASLLGRFPRFFEMFAYVSYAITALSAAVLVALWLRSLMFSRKKMPPAYTAVAASIVIGLMLNGFICGVLASPYDRFQARVIWLLPFVALLGLAVMQSANKRDQLA